MKHIGRGTLAILLGVTIVRIVYLIAFCPYELSGDEAYYWDWSRPPHLGLSYYSKGPGVAWLIAASTRVFGNAEWAIRLPAALSIGVAMLALAMLAGRIGGRRVACLTVLAFCCVPIFSGSALLMTIDAPFLACWSLACLMVWSLRERSTMAGWLALAIFMGIGFLFKYTILLLVPGVVFWLRKERRLLHVLAALIVFAVLVSPVVLWNHEHGWPTLGHLLGRLNVSGGDVPVTASRAYDPRWTLELIGAQLGLVGPLLAIMTFALRRAWRNRTEDPHAWEVSRFALATAIPIFVFYLGASLLARPEGNWPMAGFATLLVPAALAVHRGAWQRLWRVSLVYGLVAFTGLFAMRELDAIPYVGKLIPYHRVSGHRELAQRVAIAANEAGTTSIVASHYARTALLTYYLPGQPPVRNASRILEGRASAYDFFADTQLDAFTFTGGPSLLVGATPEAWQRSFDFTTIEPLGDSIYLAVGDFP
jgi:4-amino-4-deoxy-L-arabinose transferase-like glycosyltransferase